jgi:glycosyltransferase involved in cell wall biosynthesis
MFESEAYGSLDDKLASFEAWPVTHWQDLANLLEALKSRRCDLSDLTTDERACRKDVLAPLSRSIAFVTFHLSDDTLGVELAKSAEALRAAVRALDFGSEELAIHWVAGRIQADAPFLSGGRDHLLQLAGIEGFEKWGDPYFKLFASRMDRTDDAYANLPAQIWKQALDNARRLARYVEEQAIGGLVAADVASLPGNVSLTLALVLLAEVAELPVICLNHSFYWQRTPEERKTGPSSLSFFKNQHLPEVFSLIEQLYPWRSPLWIQANSSKGQSRHLLENLGFCPANVHTLPTVVDTRVFKPKSEQRLDKIRKKLENLFSRQTSAPHTVAARDFRPAAEPTRAPVILGASARQPVTFDAKTLVLLQPTRLTPERRVERDVELLFRLITEGEVADGLRQGKFEQAVLLVSGGVPYGCERYLENICNRISNMFERLPDWCRDRVFVAFAFGAALHDSPGSSSRLPTVSEIYAAGDLVLLPSETEGRGLPMMEAAATGVPIMASRFGPKAVYDEVTGSNENDEDQLRVVTFPASELPTNAEVAAGAEVIVDSEIRSELREHNLSVARKRFSKQVLVPAWTTILETMCVLKTGRHSAARRAREALLAQRGAASPGRVGRVASDRNRRYLPGYWPLGYLSSLHGLMVPSGFLREERELLSRLFSFAERARADYLADEQTSAQLHMAVRALLEQPAEDGGPLCDHSLAYRRRDFQARLHDEMTEQQLMGAVGRLAKQILPAPWPGASQHRAGLWQSARRTWQKLAPSIDTWVKRLRLLSNWDRAGCPISAKGKLGQRQVDAALGRLNGLLAIDDISLFLQQVVHRPRHLVHFPGSVHSAFLELIILGQHLLEQWRTVAARTGEEHSVTFATRREPLGDQVTAGDLEEMLEVEELSLLRDLYEAGRFRIEAYEGTSMGTHLGELSDRLLDHLVEVRASSGVVTCSGDHNAHTLDLLAAPCFRMGTVTEAPSAHIMGIEHGASYLQLVPPAARPTVGYPAFRQNARTLSRHLHSAEFKSLSPLEGSTERVFSLIAAHAERTGAPVRALIRSRLGRDQLPDGVASEEICGRYDDGKPYSASICRLQPGSIGAKPTFQVQMARKQPESVLAMARRFQGETGQHVAAAWNGGYVLNEEVVRRLGVSADLVGTPLGLLMTSGRIVSPPLFNRPALAVDRSGKLHIARISLDCPGSLRTQNPDSPAISWRKKQIDPSRPPADEPAVYTLRYPESTIDARDRVVMVLAGGAIHRIHYPCREDGRVELSPVGLHVSVPADWFYDEGRRFYFEGTRLSFDLSWPSFWDRIVDAVEAGPLLLRNGRVCINLHVEGWKTRNSILSQAGRLDLDDLRGPKIGVGLTRRNDVLIVAVNGRLRDSVGATYRDLARLMREHGAVSAMCFDPGGSATLVVEGSVRNNPPNNPGYEANPYSAPALPRAVCSAVLGILPKSGRP